MQTSTYDIVSRYLEHAEARVRQNCTSALAALAETGDAASLDALLGLAIADPAQSVRRHAETCLLRLDNVSPGVVGPALLARRLVAAGDEIPGVSLLMGRLRARGLSLVPTDPLWRRILATGSLRGVYWRAGVLPASLGALCGFVLVATVLGRATAMQTQVYVELFFATVLLAAVLVPFTVRRQQSLLFEWDERAVVSRDVLEAFGISAIVAGLVGTCLLLVEDVQFRDAARFGALIGVGVGLAAGMVHVGSAVAVRAWSRRSLRGVAQFATAFCSGLLALSAAVVLARILTSGEAIVRLQHTSIAEGTRLLAIPALSALAWALAVRDNSDADVPPEFFSGTRRLVSGAMVLLVVGLALSPYLRAELTPAPIEATTALSGQSQDRTVELTGATVRDVAFRLAFAQRVEFELQPSSDSNSLLLHEITSSGDAQASCTPGSDDGMFIHAGSPADLLLPAGCYLARVSTQGYGPSGLAGAISVYGEQQFHAAVPRELKLRLNADAAHVIDAGKRGGVSDKQYPTSWMIAGETNPVLPLSLGTPARVTVTVPNTGWSSYAAELTLLRDGRELARGFSLDEWLRAGGYTLRATGISLPTTSVYIVSEPYKDVEIPAGAQVLAVRRAPRTLPIPKWDDYYFELRAPTRLSAEVEGVEGREGGMDVVIELWSARGNIDRGDDPPRLETSLNEGTYFLKVRPYSDMSLPPPASGTLRVSFTPLP